MDQALVNDLKAQPRDALLFRNAKSEPKLRTAYIALGSNLGDRVATIEQACREMDARGVKVKRTSSLWETEPMYVLDQDRFVNGACEVCAFCYVFYYVTMLMAFALGSTHRMSPPLYMLVCVVSYENHPVGYHLIVYSLTSSLSY